MKNFNKMNPIYGRKFTFDPVSGKITGIEQADVFTRVQRVMAWQRQQKILAHPMDTLKQLFKENEHPNERNNKKQK